MTTHHTLPSTDPVGGSGGTDSKPQTDQQMRPYIDVKGQIAATGLTGAGSTIVLAGHLDSDTNFTGDKSTPIPVGQITTKKQAVEICDTYKLSYEFSGFNTINIDKTEDLAAMIIMAATAYEEFRPSTAAQALNPSNFIIAGIPNDSTKTTNPWGKSTPGILELLNQNDMRVDVFVCPYELTKGDSGKSGNYFDLIQSFVNTRKSKGDPTLGLNWVLFANTSADPSKVSSNFGNTGFQNSSNIAYYIPDSLYADSAPAIVAAQQSVQYAGMQEPFLGRYQQPLNAMEVSSKKISNDASQNLQQRGWSPIRVNHDTNTVYQSRMLSASLQDPVTGLARSYMLDFQSFRIFQLSLERIYNRIQAQGILNQRIVIDQNGNSPILDRVTNIMIGVDKQLYDDGMVAVAPSQYANQYSVKIDRTNPNHLIGQKPLYPSEIVYQVTVDETTNNFIPLIQQFNITQ
jgi:hypothetical protein